MDSVPGFRRIVHGSHAAAGPGVTEVTDGVARQLQLVTNGQHIRRLQLAMHQIPVVQKRERAERRPQHLARFVFRQGTLRQQLRKILVGKLHDDVKVRRPVELESSRAKETNQMRMRQVGGIVPVRELGLDEGRKRGNDLERHLRRLSPLNLSEKDPAVIRAAEIAAQRERANEAAFPLRPGFAHCFDGFHAHRPAMYRRGVLYRRSSQVADRSDTSLRAHYNQRWRPETAKTFTTTGGLELAQGGESLTWAATYTQSDSGSDVHGARPR